MRITTGIDMEVMKSTKRGMVLKFQPLSLAFDHVNYYVDMPAVSLLCIFFDMQHHIMMKLFRSIPHEC